MDFVTQARNAACEEQGTVPIYGSLPRVALGFALSSGAVLCFQIRFI